MKRVYQLFINLSVLITAGIGFSGCAEQHKTPDNSSPIAEKTVDYSKELYSPVEYVKLIKGINSPVRKIAQYGDLVFSVLYKPHDFIICQEERNPDLPDSTLKRKIKEIEGMEYYELKIEIEGASSEILKYNLQSAQEYTDRVNYYAFLMQKDIKLVVDDKDSISCGLYHFERAYDVVPFVKILIGFEKTDNYKTKTIVFPDRVFGQGKIDLKFTKKELTNLPKLKTT